MADGPHVERWKVFLASPGDVTEERTFARDFLRNVLPGDPLLQSRLTFEPISWDDPSHGTPLPAHLTPQQAVTRFHGQPADCQLVIVILWSRLGTHLDVSQDRKPDGSPYLSGTEWEYLNAFDASPRPEILVYRRTDEPQIGIDDPEFDKKRQQRRLVTDFFQQFTNPDSSARGGYQPYQGLEGFKLSFAADLRHLVAEHLRRQTTPPATVQPTPAPEPTRVLPPTRCLGRDDETSALTAALLTPGTASLLVLGPAGIGKTTLTRRVATDPAVTARFGPRRYFVPLETASDAATLRTAIIQAIGLSPATTSFTAALASMAEHPTLLVLDNLETPWEPDQRAAQDVLLALANTPNVSLLASLRGSTAPASPNWTHPPTRLPKLPNDDAHDLFLTLAPEAANDPTHLALFLTALGGVPLALELVAIRAGETNLAELWAEWRRRGIALAQHPDQDPGRLTSLSRSLDLSWESRRLREPGRRLFRLLGALPAGMADADRVTMLGDDAAEAARQLRAVGLAFNHDGRLDLLSPVRDYARSAHPPEGDETVLWCRHYLTQARETGGLILGAGGAAALTRLAPEVANIETALLAAETVSMRGEAVSALDGIYRLLSAAGAGSAAPLRDLAEACRAAGELRNEAQCYLSLGIIAFDRSDYDTARTAYEQARPLYQQVGDVLGEANCIQRLGDIALARSDHDTARTAYEQARSLYQQVGDLLGEANCIESLGDIALARSDHDTARTAYEQARPLYQQVGDLLGEANCIESLGDIALARSDHDTARTAYEQARALYQQVGDVVGEANCIRRLGDIALARSDHDTARTAYEQARPLYQQAGAVLGEANCIQRLGDIALARSDHDTARTAYEQARPLYQQVGAVVGEASCIAMLGRLASALGDPEAARTQIREALALFQRIQATQNIAIAHEDLVRVTTGTERATHIQAARDAWTKIGLPNEAARLDRLFP